MSLVRSRLVFVFILLSLPLSANGDGDPKGDSCHEELDCGSNIKYEICDKSTKYCRYCANDNECSVNNKNDICLDSHWCEMNSLLHSFGGSTIATVIAIFIGAFIAAGGGLGGGGIFVPVFILLLDFDAKSAAALSQATIFGGSIVNIIMNWRQVHPDKNRAHRPLTDFNTILILEPMLLAGTVMGVLLNEILPDPVILVCLMLVLTVALYRMVLKGVEQYKKENVERALQLNSNNSLVEDSRVASLVGANANFNGSTSINVNDVHGAYEILHDVDNMDIAVDIDELALQCGQLPEVLSELSSAEQSELGALVAKESQVWTPMLWMCAVWVIVSVFALFRSGDFILAVDTCSAVYWLFEFAVFPCLFMITLCITRMNMNDFNRKLQLKWKPAEGDIAWTVKKSLIYPSLAAISGLLGGLLGIGGGMIVSPLLLELGLLPRVSSASSALAVLMTASSSTFQKVLLNMIRYDYMMFFAFVGIIGTFVGQTVVNVAIRKYGRNSIVVAAVASVIAVAIVLMGINLVLNMEWNLTFDSIC